MTDDISISYKEKVLLYLKGYVGIEGQQELPGSVTQKGISEGVQMSRTHVSRVVKELEDKGLLKEKKSHVRGRNRKLKTYILSQKGISEAEELASEIGKNPLVVVKNGEEQEVKIKDIPDRTERPLNILDIVLRLEDDGKVDLDSLEPEEAVEVLGDAVEVDRLYGRERELERLKRWLEDDETFAVLMGERGHGASCLASKFAGELDSIHKIWIDVQKADLGEVHEKLEDFIKEIGVKEQGGKDLIDALKDIQGLIVFDDYYEVSDELVDFFDELVDEFTPSDRIKLIVTTRKGMPVYERFYRPEHRDGLIQEMKLSPLDRDDARNLLGKRVKKGSMDRIMMLTNGSPQLLKFLKEEDREELERCSTLEKEQISLLFFLKDDTV